MTLYRSAFACPLLSRFNINRWKTAGRAFQCRNHDFSLPFSHRGYRTGFFRPSDPRLGIVTFKLADIGEGITEVELIKWTLTEGGPIEEMGDVCVVQSDKSAVEISSPYTGTVLKFHHKPGDMIKIGTPLMDIDVPGEEDHDAAAGSEVAAAREPAGDSPSENPTPSSSTPTPSPPTLSRPTRSIRPLASPACRAIAREKNINLEEVPATGPGGRVTKGDVMMFLKNRTSEAAPAAAPKPSVPVKQVSHAQKAGQATEEVLITSPIGKGMVKSMNLSLGIPHMSLQEDVDITDLLVARSRLNAFLDSTTSGEKLTITTLILKAVSTALKSAPIMNSKFDVNNQDRYTIYHNHNISIAIDTPHGLVVPNIKNVESLGLREIQQELLQLQSLANANRLTPAHLTGGTISVSNVGVIGGTAVRPILFDGQATILGLGRTQKLPRYNPATKGFDARDVMNITASVDHRHVDGATVARFIKTLRAVMENIHTLSL